MRIGAFNINEPLPELNKPHAFAVLRPWINVGHAGSSTIEFLKNEFKAQPLGKLARPGTFIDFTRYRPMTAIARNKRTITLPNTYIDYAKLPDHNDLVFFNILEPHMFGEVYVDSILKVIRTLGIERYCLLGSMYDSVPHTRPLIVTGTAEGQLGETLQHMGVQSSDYEGPTTITTLISHKAPDYNIETLTLLVHVPQYAQMDEDHAAQLRLLEIICSLYNYSIDLNKIERKVEQQFEKLNQAVENEPRLKYTIKHLEKLYESQAGDTGKDMPKLSPEIEKFLNEIDRKFDPD
jgi:predicted ATP-grasp superfamily ATP-dependent carboligase